MRKIGICVNYAVNNYGSMLQLLATQRAVEKCGCDYEFIRYNKKTLGFMIKNLPRLFNPYYLRGVRMRFQKKRSFKSHPDIQAGNELRLKYFREYRERHFCKYSPEFKGYRNLVQGASRYDAVMVGSDQLWTPAGILGRFYNLLFVPDAIRKISYSTSFGVNRVPKNQVSMTREYLNRIDHLSVREQRGKQIVKELTGRDDCMVALDPTLLLDRKEWNALIPEKTVEEGAYIFCYLLGTNPEHRRLAEELARATGLKIVTTPHLDDFVEEDLHLGIQRFDVGPEEFLNLIRGAKYVCTDSFHGSIFSILNHKQFVTFNRFNDGDKQSRNSRIDSLFSILGLEDRRYSGELREQLDRPIDYAAVEERLCAARRDSMDFLTRALDFTEKNKDDQDPET